MFVSHKYKFILFPDPMGSCPWIGRALAPYLDQPIITQNGDITDPFYFIDMSPTEAEQAFDLTGHVFQNYKRIAIIQNPYLRMARLYDRIAHTDPLWRMRHKLGFPRPEFGRWLRQTRADGYGAGYPNGARWRRFGAWSADAWCAGRVNHIVRADRANDQLTYIFGQLGIAPKFINRTADKDTIQPTEMHRYDIASAQIIANRYRSDQRLFHSPASDLRLVA